MAGELPDEFDLIVIGTGLTESIVAAAAARVGKSVFHIDSNDYYGGYWASFNLDQMQKHPRSQVHFSDSNFNLSDSTPVLHPSSRTRILNIHEHWFDFEQFGEVNGWTKNKILAEFRKFSIDLSPKLLFSRGDLVELLISSNTSRYVEFRAVDRVATILKNRVQTVPCSRSDVFTNKEVSVVEKRLLMKCLSVCMNYESEPEEFKGYEEKTFLEFLKHKKLTPNLIHYVLYAIAMGDSSIGCEEGVRRVIKFVSSLGRYGNTPFLFPMYGCGEIPQAFCRLSAVFGGIYCLQSEIKVVKFRQEQGKVLFDGIETETQTFKGRNVVFGPGTIDKEVLLADPDELRDDPKCGGLSRAIFITSTPIGGSSQNQGGGGVMLMKLPPAEGRQEHQGAYVIQLAHWSGTVPNGLFLIHVLCEALSGDPRADLEPFVNQILKGTKSEPKTPVSEEEESENSESVELTEETIPTILWSFYFHIPRCIRCQNEGRQPPENVKLACAPFFDLDYDLSIQQAKRLFGELYPEEEFLPRAPDPDEIVMEGEDATAPKVEVDPELISVEMDTEKNEEQEESK